MKNSLCSPPTKGPQINHLAYADDIIIFSAENNKTIRLIMEQIHKYGRASGQKLNANKSFFIVALNIKAGRISRIRNATRFMDKQFPFNYLGCPIYVGRKKICYFEEMVAKIIKRISGWQGRLLSYQDSFGGPRVTRISFTGALGKIFMSLRKTVVLESEEWKISTKFATSKDGGDSELVLLYGQITSELNIIVDPTQPIKLLPRVTHIPGKLSFMPETKRKRILFGVLTQAIAVFGGTIGQVKDYLLKWSITLTHQVLLPNHIVHHIISISRGKQNNNDLAIWDLTKNGHYSNLSAWHMVRAVKQRNPLVGKVLHDCILFKMSFLIWRMIHKELPFDDTIRKFGNQHASRCNCCNIPHCESLHHVFIDSEAAKDLWKFFGNPLGIRHHAGPSSSVLTQWWRRKPKNMVHKMTIHILPITISWELWKSYTSCKFGE
ncbi:uncharacterized protein [Nicotiana sylvestris]|uniref:uncharacterized protein n=1 Tax=Nicotiana sylvestris TaxID=4096 RepID=UPI00388C4199